MTMGRRRLIGDNNARYSGVPEEEQLFKIEELSISPRPPVTNTRLFALLKGQVKGVSATDLEQTVLKIPTTSNRAGPWVLDENFADYPHIVVRQELRHYSKYIKPGTNDIIGDMILYSWFLQTATYTFNADAKLPDGRTLFCFEFQYYIEGEL